jgi:hypothetical protein
VPELGEWVVGDRLTALRLVLKRGLLRPTVTPPLRHRVLYFLEQHPAWAWALGVALLLSAAAWVRPRFAPDRRRLAALTMAGGLGLMVQMALGGRASVLPVLAGAGMLGAIRAVRAREPDATVTLLAYGLTFAFTTAWLPFNWARYYLPVMVLAPVFATWALRDAFMALTSHVGRPSRAQRAEIRRRRSVGRELPVRER